MTRTMLCGLMPVLMGLVAGCAAPGFEKKWNRAVAGGIPASGMQGPWTGTWKSDATGHTGKLRCVVESPEDPAIPWDFHYWFTWDDFQGSYSVAHGVREEKGVYRFTGEADLGILGGVYRHDGTATRDRFESSYRSARDRGSFSMTRPAVSTASPAAGTSSSVGGRRYRRRRRWR